MSPLFDGLIAEYRVFRQAVRGGARPHDLSDVTPREHAGMYLAMFSVNALGNFDQVANVATAEKLSPVARETRRLILDALAEQEREDDP